MKLSRRKQEIENLRASDPLAQIMERQDIDYGSEELPTSRIVSVDTLPAPEPPTECCPDWKPGMNKINGYISLAHLRAGNGSQYSGKPFIYCPWCGVFRKDFERDFAMKLAEAQSKGLL